MLLNNLKNYRITLVSQSPRRRNLLKELGFEFEVTSVDIPEEYEKEMKPEEVALYLAELKANAFSFQSENTLIITADTIVSLKGEILGKPKNTSDANRILKYLSGNIHDVITGVCIKTREKHTSFYSKTHVHFKELDDEEIRFYVDQYKPYDKAGSYGIQEWIGYIGIDRIEGSFYNVMGLPVQRLYEELKNF